MPTQTFISSEDYSGVALETRNPKNLGLELYHIEMTLSSFFSFLFCCCSYAVYTHTVPDSYLSIKLWQRWCWNKWQNSSVLYNFHCFWIRSLISSKYFILVDLKPPGHEAGIHLDGMPVYLRTRCIHIHTLIQTWGNLGSPVTCFLRGGGKQ